MKQPNHANTSSVETHLSNQVIYVVITEKSITLLQKFTDKAISIIKPSIQNIDQIL